MLNRDDKVRLLPYKTRMQLLSGHVSAARSADGQKFRCRQTFMAQVAGIGLTGRF